MSRKSVYRSLAGKLEKRAAAMAENALLPSENRLAETYGVSKVTLRRALQVLVDKGIVRKINGVGAMVVRAPTTLSRELVFLCHDTVFFAETLRRFGAAATAGNYLPSIIPLTGDAVEQGRIVSSVAASRPAGVVVYADPAHDRLPAFHELAAAAIPAVYLMRLPRGIDGNCVYFGNADGLTEIVKTFYREGCRRFVLFGDPEVNPAAAVERTRGFLNGMSRCRLRPKDGYLCGPDATEEHRETFLALFEDPGTRPDAVCCLNDRCAGVLLSRLARRGVDVEGIRFSGFDHSPLSAFLPRPLLTVEPPMGEMGAAAVEMLLTHVENPGYDFRRRKLKAKVVRAGGRTAVLREEKGTA